MKKQTLIYTVLRIAFIITIVIIFCINTQHTPTVGLQNESGSDVGIVLDLNTATAEQLTYLPGIGNDLADRIITYREHVGGFRSVEELLNVDGIGEQRYNDLSKYLTVGGTE